jgi:CheY-like chemotaxis protein
VELEVLLVDDDPVVHFMHKKLMTKAAIANKQIALDSAQQALNYLIENADKKAQYLIFLDINMPVMDGWGFLDELQKMPIAENCHVVMVTSSIDKFDRENATKYNRVIGYYEKPLSVASCNEIKSIAQISPFIQF